MAPIIIEVSLVLPQYAHWEDARHAAYLDNIWEN